MTSTRDFRSAARGGTVRNLVRAGLALVILTLGVLGSGAPASARPIEPNSSTCAQLVQQYRWGLMNVLDAQRAGDSAREARYRAYADRQWKNYETSC